MGTDASPMMLRMIVLFSYKTVTIADTKQLQGRRITFLYDNQRYFLEKYYLYSQKKHEYLDYIEQYPRSAS